MKTRLLFHQADLVAQALACIIPLLAAAMRSDIDIAMTAYIFVGGIQIISCVLHGAIINDDFRSPHRTGYLVTLFGIFIVFCLAFTLPALAFLMLYALLIISPVLAVWYFFICVQETRMLSVKIDREKWI